MSRVRFAPSPTGSLHLGSLRVAIVNYLFAKKEQASLVLRIEDTDQLRSTDQSTRIILENLRWMGIDFNEGPFFQSQRLSSHQAYAKDLLRKKQAYCCFCSQQEENDLSGQKDPCRLLSPEQTEMYLSQQRPYVIRLRIPDQTIEFKDLIKGKVSFQGNLLEDFVILRSDGTPTYNFAVVADDHEMGITHIIRGEDHLSNTPKQIALYQAFGWSIPTFAHIPLILGPDRTKLSKRHCDTAIEDYQQKGFLAVTLFNYLALLGYSHDPAHPILSKEALIRDFSWEKVSRSPSQFDLQRLIWMNKQYLDQLSDQEYLHSAVPWIPKLPFDQDKIAKIVLLSRNQVRIWSEIPAVFSLFLTYPVTPIFESNPCRDNLVAGSFLQYIKERLSGCDFTVDVIQCAMEEAITQFALKKRDAMQWLRIAIAGTSISPSLYETVCLLGKEETLRRIGLFMEQGL